MSSFKFIKRNNPDAELPLFPSSGSLKVLRIAKTLPELLRIAHELPFELPKCSVAIECVEILCNSECSRSGLPQFGICGRPVEQGRASEMLVFLRVCGSSGDMGLARPNCRAPLARSRGVGARGPGSRVRLVGQVTSSWARHPRHCYHRQRQPHSSSSSSAADSYARASS